VVVVVRHGPGGQCGKVAGTSVVYEAGGNSQILRRYTALDAVNIHELVISVVIYTNHLVKLLTLVIAPLTKKPVSEAQRYGMCCKIFLLFVCTLMSLSANGMNHAFAFPAEAVLILPIPEGWKAEST